MAIPTMQDDLSIIAGLGDNPNTDNNLSEEQLKAKFDEGPKRIKKFINTVLVPGMNKLIGAVGFTGTHAELAERDAADQHPIAAITGLEEALNGKAPGDHDHDGSYSAKNHDHDGSYAALNHGHGGAYLELAEGAVAMPLILKRGMHYGTAQERPEAPEEGQQFLKLTPGAGGTQAATVAGQAYGAATMGSYSTAEADYAGWNGSANYGYCLKFTTGELAAKSDSLRFSLLMTKGMGDTANLRYALCASDANKASYVGTAEAVADENQLATGTVTFEGMGTNPAAKEFTVATGELESNTTCYLFLWSADMTGVSIQAATNHTVTVTLADGTMVLSMELYVNGEWLTLGQEG